MFNCLLVRCKKKCLHVTKYHLDVIKILMNNIGAACIKMIKNTFHLEWGKKHLEPFINLDVKKGTVRTYRYKNYSQNWEKITILTSIYKNCTSQN
jgi:hypothetical protein